MFAGSEKRPTVSRYPEGHEKAGRNPSATNINEGPVGIAYHAQRYIKRASADSQRTPWK